MKKGISYKRALARQRRHWTIRKKISGTADCPRLAVYRSLAHIYAQIIDDVAGKTLVSMSSKAKDLSTPADAKRVAISFAVGQTLGTKALAAGIKKVRFDRGGFLYHGRVKALADGARKAGLEF